VPRRKVAIIGGGMGALTAAYCLTDPALGNDCDVTVYTMGWRLGGKGASGRQQDVHNRILEHGLHIWFGTYHNAIALMRRCYAELGRSAGQPLSTFDAAFKAQRRLVLLEQVGGQTRPWAIEFADLPDLGGGTTVLGLLRRIIGWLGGTLAGVAGLRDRPVSQFAAHQDPAGARILAALSASGGQHSGQQLLDYLAGAVQNLQPGGVGSGWLADLISDGLWLLARVVFDLLRPGLPNDDTARRTWIIAYLGISFARGILDDRLFEKGFDAVENIEMRAWLTEHSAFTGSPDQPAADGTAYWSATIQAFYDASFSYVDGDAAQPNVSASVALRCMLRILFDYAGPIILEMQAGMGDTVFAPLYTVLQRRGVRFEFFQRMTGLSLDASGQLVDRIELSQQVQIPDPGAYQPLFNVLDLPCWPSEPFYGQITDGAQLQASGANIEHWDSGWNDTGPARILQRGQDFDHVVLGISYDVLPLVTQPLCADAKWRAMLGGLNTADTQAAQLWFARDRAGLGMDPRPEIFGAYVEPWSSLTDFSHLLGREDWPAGNAPLYLNYTCGPLAKSADPSDAAVYRRLRDFVQHNAAPLWPNTAGPAGFDYDYLYADPGITGEDRLKAQYWRANTDATERYVIAKAGTAAVRLQPGATGFSNLSIAGEWTDTGVNISSIEGTVISGMRVSRALTGQPQRIPGESDV
jgi:uncharacterized protein with NAD-binding domain and iron-sulfur cluster